MLTELNQDELIQIDGGHEGTAYQIGHIVGTAISVAYSILFK